MKKNLLLACLVVLTILYCKGQKILLNKNYQSNIKEYKVAIIPYFSAGSNPINDIFYKAFNKDKFRVIDTIALNYNIRNQEMFNNSLHKTVVKTFEKKHHPNLYLSLTEAEITDFKTKFLDSDILIIPSKLESRKVAKVNGSGNISLAGNIVVFDLRTGEFIMYYSSKVKKQFKQINENIPYPVEELTNSFFDGLIENL